MNKNAIYTHVLAEFNTRGIAIIIMRSFLLYILLGLSVLKANDTYAQTKLNIDLKDVTLETLIKEIQENSEYIFFYKDGILPKDTKISIRRNGATLKAIFDEVLDDKHLGYKIVDRQVTIFQKKTTETLVNSSKNLNQGFTVSGIVLDPLGIPLAGTNILEKGTTNGTQTDFDGNFSLVVTNGNATLVASYIGFLTKEIPVSKRINITITLEENASTLDEIVVIGYGTQKKSDLTGSVASLNQDDFNQGANASVDQLMLGRAAGVQITQTNSEPGGGLSIRIRGASSVNAGNEPLYVIDGFPVDNSSILGTIGGAGTGTNQNPRNPLNSLNPNDVESIEILKDASSTAIYGSRGANGVILITTKKGKSGRLSINYNQISGIQSVAKSYDLLNTQQYMDGLNGLSVDSGNDVIFTSEDISAIGRGTDWQRELFTSALISSHDLSFSGGDEKTTFFTSLNYFDQNGIVKETGIKKYIARVNLERSFGERFKMGINLNTSLINDNNALDNLDINQTAGPIASALLYDPTEFIFNEDGTLTESPNLTLNNPFSLIKGISSENRSNRTFGNLFFQYAISSNLSAKLNFGSDQSYSRRDIYNSTLTQNGAGAGGIANIATLELSNELLEYTMTYDKAFNENHSLNVLGGVTYQNFVSRTFAGTISGFPSDVLGTNNLSIGNTDNDNLSSFKQKNNLLSYLGRVNYSLFDKFLLTASIRADGSSRFGSENRWGYFPSFAAGWKMSEESFIPDIFNEFKLRASWGQTGNQEIPNLSSKATFTNGRIMTFGGNVFTSLTASRIANPNLKWETTDQFNIGLDLAFAQNRFSATFDYFIKKTNDMLFNSPLPTASGFNSILSNIGSMENKGFELLISSVNVSTPNFQWSTTLNFSAIKNKVLDLGNVDEIVTGNINTSVGNTSIIRVGEPLASYYGYEVTGIFQESDDISGSAQPFAQPGYPIFKDVNGDNTITPDDQVVLGNPFPDFTYGIQNSISYKDIQFDFFIQGQEGADLLNINVIESMYPANLRRNRIAEQVLDRWTPTNTDARWPSGVNPSAYGGGKINSLVIQDASYIRLKNVRLAYNFPTDRLNFLKSLQISVTGQNLITITNYVGFDPEANSFGNSNLRVDYSSYPLAKSYLIGLNVGF